MAKPTRLVVFDWDGTLMDSTAQIVAAASGAIAQLGLPARPPEAIRDIIGLGLRESWQRLFPELGPQSFTPFVAAYRDHFFAPELQTAQLFARAEEVVAELAGRGFLLGVATGKSRRGLDRDLETTGLGRFMAGSRTADETRSKPHPDMLLELMAALGTPAAATLMVGDTEWDLEMARRAGVPAVAVSYGAHAPERLRAHAPIALIDALDALLPLLD
ncbi:MAG TPA: HAD-IA family hydrolase [Gammaproteobacteria bacterium]|nr:HAD-IA family hydrolase [Gammaproteobacteria bacterium]HRP87108.1 HAD-IA family hydrolase [Gammaproteobacteria bacterium]